MGVTVRVPTPLQRLTNGQGEVSCEGRTVTDVLGDLERRYPGVKERICDQDGKLRRFVNVFVNETDIRFLQGDQTAVKDGDEVSIIPAIAGGSHGVFQEQHVVSRVTCDVSRRATQQHRVLYDAERPLARDT